MNRWSAGPERAATGDAGQKEHDMKACRLVALALSTLAGSAAALAQEPASPASASASSGGGGGGGGGVGGGAISDRATFTFWNDRLHGDPEILWPGFLNGMRGFEHFHEPIGQPLYFESPFINSNVRLVYLHHNFPDKSQLQGGDLHVVGAQARLALTDRLAFIATKDGHSWLNAGILQEDDGWNDIAVGLKYALVVDKEADLVITPGIRWEWSNGDNEVLQGGADEFSPFVSIAKGLDKLHLIGNMTVRVPEEEDDGNMIFSWDLHVDYDLGDVVKGFAPVLEIHGLHYLTDGTRLPLRVGGMDYDNFGSSDVAGTSVIWVGLGGRFRLSPHASLGATFELPLTNRNSDIMDNRVTVDLTFTW